MKVLVLTDTHIRGTTPSRRTDNFKETLITKLKEVAKIAKEEQVDYIFHGGDLFDRPDTAPSVVSEFLRVLRDYPVPIYIVAGNHDLYGHNPETLPRTMLGILEASGIVRIVSDKPIFLEEKGIKLQLTGSAFSYEIDAKGTTAYNVKKAKEADYALHLAHGMLLDKPFIDEVDYTLIDDIETEADITVVGHYHLGFGKKKFNGKYFLNPGALVRSSAALQEINRKPQVAIVEFGEEIDIRLRKLKSAKKGREVLDRSELEQRKFKEKQLAEFNRQIEVGGELKGLDINDILDDVASNTQVEKEVKKEALARIEKAQQRLGGLNSYE